MKIQVLFREDGRIVSVSRVTTWQETDDRGIPPLRSGPEPRDGQHVAIVAVDAMWEGRSLREIHERFRIVDDERGVRLVEQGAASTRA